MRSRATEQRSETVRMSTLTASTDSGTCLRRPAYADLRGHSRTSRRRAEKRNFVAYSVLRVRCYPVGIRDSAHATNAPRVCDYATYNFHSAILWLAFNSCLRSSSYGVFAHLDEVFQRDEATLLVTQLLQFRREALAHLVCRASSALGLVLSRTQVTENSQYARAFPTGACPPERVTNKHQPLREEGGASGGSFLHTLGSKLRLHASAHTMLRTTLLGKTGSETRRQPDTNKRAN